MKTLVLTFLALVAFAGNSVLCRLALYDNEIDATSFTIIRLLSGAVALWCLLFLSTLRQSKVQRAPLSLGSIQAWVAPFVLFLYAALFSFAYLLLNTGVGALFLFGAVQMTMIGVAIYNGRRLLLQEWCGALLAFSGLVYLISPSFYQTINAEEISLLGAAMMTVSGVAWGLYSVKGGQSTNPLNDTANNFVKSIPFVIVLLLVFLVDTPQISTEGLLLALASGVITSGLGYAIWYSALKGLSSIQAAVVQLFVPVLAALGGLLFAGEQLTAHVLIAGAMVIAGVLWVTFVSKR